MAQAVKDDLVLNIEQTLEIKAAPEKVFEGLIGHLCDIEGGEGKRIKLKLERRPGGRWFRDLGSDSGHLWGLVQSIKPPTLLEMFGPMMMSHPVAGHMIIRLTPIAGGTIRWNIGTRIALHGAIRYMPSFQVRARGESYGGITPEFGAGFVWN